MDTTKKIINVKKIMKSGESWIIRGTDEKEYKIPLSDDNNGKLPPKFKFPWQKHILEIETLWDEILFAQMDGVKLFRKHSPSPATQKLVNLFDKAMAQETEERLLIKEQITLRLNNFIEVQEIPNDLEKQINSMPFLFRGWLKGLLYSQKQTCFDKKKLTLLFRLSRTANAILKRYNGDTLDSWKTLNGLSMMLKDYLQQDDVHYQLHMPEDVLKIHQDAEDKYQFPGRYGECKEAVWENGLFEKDDVQKHLLLFFTMFVRKIMRAYVDDMDTLRYSIRRDFYGRRIYSDEEEYKNAIDKLKLHKLTDDFWDVCLSEKQIDYLVNYCVI